MLTDLELSLKLIWAEKLLKDVLLFIEGKYYKRGFYPIMKGEISQFLNLLSTPKSKGE